MTTRGLCGIALVAVATALALKPAPSLTAETKPPTRGDSAKYDLAGVADREAHQVWVNFEPGAAETPHFHNAEVFAFVVEGTLMVEGPHGDKTTLKAGAMYHVLPREVHAVSNPGSAPAKLAVVFIAEKGKPVTTQAN